MDTGIVGARMLQHAERMMSAVDSTTARAGRPDQVSHGGTEAQRKRGLASHPLRAARVRTEGAMFLSVPPCLRASVRDFLIERSTPPGAETMSARQTESERSEDGVCGTDGVSRRLRRERFRRLRLRALMG